MDLKITINKNFIPQSPENLSDSRKVPNTDFWNENYHPVRTSFVGFNIKCKVEQYVTPYKLTWIIYIVKCQLDVNILLRADLEGGISKSPKEVI